jgi:hypothetical protein
MSHGTEQRERGGRDEERQVRSWRREQFLAMGFSLAEARRLTTTAVDLGEMRRLLTAGCPLDTARRILV